MMIKREKYEDLGIKKELLDYVATDEDGYIQHDPFCQIGRADEPNTLFNEVARALSKEAFIDGKPNEEVWQWFLENEDKNHEWREVVNI